VAVSRGTYTGYPHFAVLPFGLSQRQRQRSGRAAAVLKLAAREKGQTCEFSGPKQIEIGLSVTPPLPSSFGLAIFLLCVLGKRLVIFALTCAPRWLMFFVAGGGEAAGGTEKPPEVEGEDSQNRTVDSLAVVSRSFSAAVVAECDIPGTCSHTLPNSQQAIEDEQHAQAGRDAEGLVWTMGADRAAGDPGFKNQDLSGLSRPDYEDACEALSSTHSHKAKCLTIDEVADNVLASSAAARARLYSCSQGARRDRFLQRACSQFDHHTLGSFSAVFWLAGWTKLSRTTLVLLVYPLDPTSAP
jgi:hypothetical protein